jgi:AraC family transcriptional regulator of adaptative response/methylated-DNA-[protein]-cysteine methyltransferase
MSLMTFDEPNVSRVSDAFATDAARWAAVSLRDPRAEGAFLYGVRTTGVYCRPTCHSRRPRRENVSFYTSPSEAEGAGFRACKRCAPDAAEQPTRYAEAVAQTCRRLDLAESVPTLAELASEVGLSPFHFQRVFKRITGVSPKQYALAQRERRLRAQLEAGRAVTAAVYDAGYGSSSGAYVRAPETLGMTPGTYRDGAPGETVRYGFTMCSLGQLLVAATERGVCAIELGDDEPTMSAMLGKRFPKAQIERGSAAFAATLDAVVRFLDTPRAHLVLPLDIRGTAFQRRVWEALRRIPAGTMVTYAGLAAQLGQPRAARAVAQACGANGLAVAIPCHRVVGAQGALGGYRWGIERKKALLTREAS